MADPTTAGTARSWIISGAVGVISDYQKGDSYSLLERSPDKPENPLPPYSAWRLRELPARRPTAQ
jgi:hypothetical protein